ncbi:NAD-dependent epimerase/dehydratase family protein [Phreatobacter sp.]|uniref:NAD-dependent epimerase/dehydratase family protein n=1 Tax=Phreatobacter sp. TaxID=1966341 RepID=UPI003F6F6C55
MRVVVTGAAGFLGRRLVEDLARRGVLAGADGHEQVISEIVLVDRVAPALPRGGATVRMMTGDIRDPALSARLVDEGFDSLFHLASSLTLEAETDPLSAHAVNVEPLRRIVEGCRGCPRVVFTSSIAVFGGPLPDIVDDAVRPAPATTYGTHKAINELLIADASRRGRVDGRSLRLPIVLVRPGSAVPAISDRIAAILREPLQGKPAVSPLRPETVLPLVSAGAVVRALLALHDVAAPDLPANRAMNLPALSVTVEEMVEALARHGGREVAARVTIAPDPALQAIVDGWPRHFVSGAAFRLGLQSDAGMAALIEDHLADMQGIGDGG